MSSELDKLRSCWFALDCLPELILDGAHCPLGRPQQFGMDFPLGLAPFVAVCVFVCVVMPGSPTVQRGQRMSFSRPLCAVLLWSILGVWSGSGGNLFLGRTVDSADPPFSLCDDVKYAENMAINVVIWYRQAWISSPGKRFGWCESLKVIWAEVLFLTRVAHSGRSWLATGNWIRSLDLRSWLGF